MSSNRYRVRAELLDRLRRFEWTLARDEHARAARKMLRGRTHELMNFVQIVDLASQALAPHTKPPGDEFIADLGRAANDAKAAVRELQLLGHADERVPSRTMVGAAARGAIELVRAALDTLDAQVLVGDALCVAWTPEELEVLIVALCLDGDRDAALELIVRARDIDGRPCLELIFGPLDPAGVAGPLCAALAARIGGDSGIAERRGGGHELAVSVPVLG